MYFGSFIISNILYILFVIGFGFLLKHIRSSSSKRWKEQKTASSRELYEQQKNKKSIYNRGREPEIWRNISLAIDSPHDEDVQRAMDEIDADTQNNSISLTDGILIGQKWFKHKSYVIRLSEIRELFVDNSSRDRDGIKELQIIMFSSNPYLSFHFIKPGYSYENARKITETICSHAPHALITDVTREPFEQQRKIYMELKEKYPYYHTD